MRIFFQRTGGFAGTKLEGSLDSSALPASQARQLQQLLKKSCFFDLPPILKSDRPDSDRFSYKVTVETEEGIHTVEAGEAAVPVSMRPLLDFIARSVRGKSR